MLETGMSGLMSGARKRGGASASALASGLDSTMGWLLVGKSKHNDTPLMSKYAPDLAKDHFYVWLNDYHWVPMIVLGILLFAVGGVRFVLWGVFLRVVVGLHTTWLVNSATHMWGSRRFATPDDSRNNWLIALITSGEGWHNNHHAHPTSARHGLAWYEFDLSWVQITVLRLFGLAKHVRVARLHERLVELEAAHGTREKQESTVGGTVELLRNSR